MGTGRDSPGKGLEEKDKREWEGERLRGGRDPGSTSRERQTGIQGGSNGVRSLRGGEERRSCEGILGRERMRRSFFREEDTKERRKL